MPIYGIESSWIQLPMGPPVMAAADRQVCVCVTAVHWTEGWKRRRRRREEEEEEAGGGGGGGGRRV